MSFPIKKVFSGSVLKWAAIITMLIDHIGASGLCNEWALRLIGRTAFPLFVFLLTEGAVHTRNMRKYLARLGVFALLSEIPFDLAIFGMPFYRGHQNVFLTLVLGLAVIWLFQQYPPGTEKTWKASLGLVLSALLAEVLHTDYGSSGVLVIVLMYLLRERPWLRFGVCYVLLALMSSTELWCLPAFLLMAFYNGERGRQPKYFFYGFYPAHLLLLWFLERFVFVISW